LLLLWLSYSAHTISKHQELSKIVLLKIIKFCMTMTHYFLSYGSPVQILRENNNRKGKYHLRQQ
jgi:hypothetical protein